MASDFHKVENLKFDVSKLQNALKTVLQRKNYDNAAGTKYIAGISLNQIPGNPDSAKGENVKGIYWTRPDSSGKEVVRAKRINEAAYTEFVDELKDTYFKEVYIQTVRNIHPLMRIQNTILVQVVRNWRMGCKIYLGSYNPNLQNHQRHHRMIAFVNLQWFQQQGQQHRMDSNQCLSQIQQTMCFQHYLP